MARPRAVVSHLACRLLRRPLLHSRKCTLLLVSTVVQVLSSSVSLQRCVTRTIRGVQVSALTAARNVHTLSATQIRRRECSCTASLESRGRGQRWLRTSWPRGTAVLMMRLQPSGLNDLWSRPTVGSRRSCMLLRPSGELDNRFSTCYSSEGVWNSKVEFKGGILL
jgi:hypothetical protein